MGSWAGFLGPGGESGLRSLLGSQGQSYTAADFGLGVDSNGGDPAMLTIAENNQVTAGIVRNNSGSSAAVDPSGPTLTLKRDPFGFHGLYTTRIDRILWFASNLQTLQQLPGVSNRLEASALHAYLCFSYVPTPLTLTPGIFAMPAGEEVVLTPDEEQRQSVSTWSESEPSDLDEETAIAELRDRLRQAVESSSRSRLLIVDSFAHKCQRCL